MRWIQGHSRLIASAALAGMLTPVLASAISTVTAIPTSYLAIGLIVLIVIGLVWMSRTQNQTEPDE